jgi:hypothetical protein
VPEKDAYSGSGKFSYERIARFLDKSINKKILFYTCIGTILWNQFVGVPVVIGTKLWNILGALVVIGTMLWNVGVLVVIGMPLFIVGMLWFVHGTPWFVVGTS